VLTTPEEKAVAASIERLLDELDVHVGPAHEPVSVTVTPPLQLIGRGRDAAVVQHPLLPDRVFKVYAPENLGRLDDEYRAYRRLAGCRFFPVCIGRGPRHLVLSYEAGPTLYDCVVQGIPIPNQVMLDVEDARRHARAVGLRPKDVHLRNVVVQAGRAKLLDVAQYGLPTDEDRVWDHLVLAYRYVYPLLRGRRIPASLLELVKRQYKVWCSKSVRFGGLVRRLLRLLGLHRQATARRPAPPVAGGDRSEPSPPGPEVLTRP
jgi:hypothetical protein